MKKIIPLLCTLLLFSGTCSLNANADLFNSPQTEYHYTEDVQSVEKQQDVEEQQVVTNKNFTVTESTPAKTEQKSSFKSFLGCIFCLLLGLFLGAVIMWCFIFIKMREKMKVNPQNDLNHTLKLLQSVSQNIRQCQNTSEELVRSIDNEKTVLTDCTKKSKCTNNYDFFQI